MIEYKASEENVFAITYDRFENLAGISLRNLAIEYHIRNIAQLGIIGFLLEQRWNVSKSKHSVKDTLVPSLTLKR